MPTTTVQQAQMFLGELLVQKKLISSGQLDRALTEQKIVKKRLGEVLLNTKAISRQQLESVLMEQRLLSEDADQTYNTQSCVREILNQVFLTRRITLVEQELLMSILLSEENVGFEERNMIEQLLEKIRKGWIRVM
jgi:hypothetical protein